MSESIAFAPNALGTFGTSGGNILRGPRAQNVHLGVSFNLLNQPTLSN